MRLLKLLLMIAVGSFGMLGQAHLWWTPFRKRQEKLIR
jgi:hypothetical protein